MVSYWVCACECSLGYQEEWVRWFSGYNCGLIFTSRSSSFRHNLIRSLINFFAGLNMKVCVGMGILQMVIWAVWAGVTRHPSRWKLWVVVIGGAVAMLLEIYDFPPYSGLVDAHALWHATTIPLTYIWWSFIRDDTEFRTSILMKKSK